MTPAFAGRRHNVLSEAPGRRITYTSVTTKDMLETAWQQTKISESVFTIALLEHETDAII